MIIAFSGKAGAGKTTCARWLAYKYGALVFSFAAPLKAELRDMGFCPDMKTPAVRRVMQAVGAARREQNFDYYIRIMDRLLAAALRAKYPLIAIDDLRFSDEKDYLLRLNQDYQAPQKRGPLRLVRIVKICDAAQCDDDLSETELDDFDAWHLMLSAVAGDVDKLTSGISIAYEEGM